MSLRPLKRVGEGVWHSADGAWTFVRPDNARPTRWFAYYLLDAEPAFPRGHFKLHDAVSAVERLSLAA